MDGSKRAAAALAAFVFVAGCQTGGGPIGPSYEVFDSDAPVTSDLSTVAVRTGDDNSAGVTQGTGAISHSNGALSVDDGTYTFSDTNGPTGTGIYSDGTSIILRQNDNLNTTGYEYVIGYTQVYSNNGVAFESQGLAGIATRVEDIPTDGTVIYRGDAYATVTTQGNGPVQMTQGTSTIGANFGSGTVDATLNNFGSVVDAAGDTVPAPVDTIVAAGMSIQGNTFSGGQIVTLGNGVATSVTGVPTTTQTGGAFYGYDQGISAPDEVGGMIYVVGPNGSISGGFVAD